ncbi:MAG: hypothetical protein ACR2KK_02325 [Acidimicrobiales bacterium]
MGGAVVLGEVVAGAVVVGGVVFGARRGTTTAGGFTGTVASGAVGPPGRGGDQVSTAAVWRRGKALITGAPFTSWRYWVDSRRPRSSKSGQRLSMGWPFWS